MKNHTFQFLELVHNMFDSRTRKAVSRLLLPGDGLQVFGVDLLDAGKVKGPQLGVVDLGSDKVGGLQLRVVDPRPQDNSLVLLHQKLVHVGGHCLIDRGLLEHLGGVPGQGQGRHLDEIVAGGVRKIPIGKLFRSRMDYVKTILNLLL